MKAASDSVRQRAFVVSLHDVSPLSWPLYRPFMGWLDSMGGVRSTLLVVPNFHRKAAAELDAPFCAAMRERQRLGDELVLHGLTHTDDAPSPRTPSAVLRRRILTHEGEFAALDHDESRIRIQAGLALCREQGWRVEGFVPPGWMSNRHSRCAIREAGFLYRTDTRALYALREERRFVMPTLVMSSRSGWRRQLFAGLNHWRLQRHAGAPLIRLAIHPVDLQHASSLAFWKGIIHGLHAEGRRSITKRQWLEELLSAASAEGVPS